MPAERNHSDELMRHLVDLAVNDTCHEAVLALSDGTRLCFCHKVGERWAKALGPPDAEDRGGLAAQILETIRLFRLNSRHLEIFFHDGSEWERRFDPRRG
jgi:hypothetical protein